MAPSINVQPGSADGCWKNAYDSLDEKLRASISGARTGRNDILRAVMQTANQKREICIHKQWKFKLPSGEVIIIRDVVEKIAKWVNAFVAVGDVAVQYDPATAALPWAAVRFILQAAISDTQVEGALVADLEIISRLISRYKDFERIHHDRPSVVKTQISEGVTRLYADVLKFLAIAVKYFDSNSLARTVKNVLRPPDKILMESIVEKEAELLKIAGLSDTEKLHYLEASVTRLVDQTSIYQKKLDEAKHLELLRWLSSSPFTRHHEAISESRMPNSAAWLLGHSEYKTWRNSSSSAILLLHGIQGSGKSNICSAVIDSFLGERSSNPPAAPLAYFYCAECEFELERGRADNVMRSLLRQLTVTDTGDPMVRDIILSDFERRSAQSKVDGMDFVKLTVRNCVDLILEVTTRDPVTIVVDALDEVKEADRPGLINALEDIVVGSASVVKVFLTSRNNSHVFSLLKKNTANLPASSEQQQGKPHIKKIEINRDETMQDMRSYVTREIQRVVQDRRLLKNDPSSELLDLLEEKLLIGAGEMFQWVNVQIESLCHHNREHDIVSVLQSGTLVSLDATYTRLLDRILIRENSESEIAIRAISWLLYMKEAMHPDVFLVAVFPQTTIVNISQTREELLAICSSFVTVDSKSNTFRFSHNSVQEFLRAQDVFSPSSAQHILATTCLRVCTRGPFHGMEPEAVALGELYSYAAVYWAYHFSAATATGSCDSLSNDIISFVYDEPGDESLSFMEWLHRIADIAKDLPDEHQMKPITSALANPQGSPLFVASAFGLDCLLSDIALGTGTINWDQKSGSGHTSVYLACAFGNLSTAQALLSRGANPKIKGGKFGNPLQAACFHGHTSVAQLLLEYGASIHSPGSFCNAFEACFRGQREATVMALLKHESAIPNDIDFQPIWEWAAQGGFLEVIDWLERIPPDPKAPNPGNTVHQSERIKSKTARAIQGGQAGTLAAFLKNKPTPLDLLPSGSIAMAAMYGHEAVVDLLIDMKIDIEDECKLGSPLRCAALMDRERVMRKLIAFGANVNSCGQYGTALQAASMKGNIRIVKLLLRNNAKADQMSNGQGTALEAAAFHGHYDVVEVLLDFGPEVSSNRKVVESALGQAAESGHYHIMKLMIDKGFQHSARIYAGYFGAECSTNISKVRYLLRDYSPSRKDSEKAKDLRSRRKLSIDNLKVMRPLEISAATGQTSAVAILLESKSILDVSDYEIRASIKTAAKHGHLEIFRLLFSHFQSPPRIGPDTRIENYHRQDNLGLILMVLLDAVTNNQVEIVQFAIKALDLNNWTSYEFAKLMEIACINSQPVQSQLLHVANYLSEGENEAMPEVVLDQATRLGDVQIINILIGRSQLKNGIRSWLSKAAKYGKTELIGLLLLQHSQSKQDIEAVLVEASRCGHVQVVTLLLQHLAKLETESARSAFGSACIHGHTSVASTLLRVVDEDVAIGLAREGLPASAWYGHADMVILLADHLPKDSLKTQLFPSLVAAAGNGNLESLKALLGLRDKDARERHTKDITFALALAAFHGHEEVVRTLIKAGADVNATQSGSIMFDYIVPGKPFNHWFAPRFRQTLWDRPIVGSDIWFDHLSYQIQWTPPIIIGNERSDRIEDNKHTRDGIIGDIDCYQVPGGAQFSPDERVGALQAAMAGLEQHHQNRYTIFSDGSPWTSASGTMADRENIVKVLLDHGADANALGSRTRLPIVVASGCCSEQVVSWLIDAGADINAVAIDKSTFSPTSQIRPSSGSGIQEFFTPFPPPPPQEIPVATDTSTFLPVSQCQPLIGVGVGKALTPAASIPLPKPSAAADVSAVLAIDQNELSAGSVLRRLLQAGATLGLDGNSIDNLLRGCLEFFDGDGCFVQIETLVDAFIDGPGSAVQIILRELPWVQIGHLDLRCFFQSAIVLDDLACVELLLERHVDVNAVGSYYCTALQAAAVFGHFEITQRLLEAGADPNLVNGCHGTALRAAVLGDHTATVELLLKHGADASFVFIQKLNSWDITLPNPLLHLAVEWRNARIVSMLVSAGVDVVSDPPDHLHPLILACREGSPETVKCLLDAGSPSNVLGKKLPYQRAMADFEASPIHMASYHGHEDILRLLLSNEAKFHGEPASSRTPLQLATQNGHVSVIRVLLTAGAKVNQLQVPVLQVRRRRVGTSALDLAASQGDLAVVKELLAANATIYDPTNGRNALQRACYPQSTVVLEHLLEVVSNTENGAEAIMDAYNYAVKGSRHTEVLTLLRDFVPPSIDLDQ